MGRRRAGRVRRGDGGKIRLGEIQARARGRFVLRLQEVVGRECAQCGEIYWSHGEN